MIADLRAKGRHQEASNLKKFFGLKREIAYSGEHAFYWTICRLLPKFHDLEFFQIALDKPASYLKNKGLPKNMTEYRPDYFHVFGEGPNAIALLGEFDENTNHEDCPYRLRDIAQIAEVPIDRIFVYRVNGRQNADDALFKMNQRLNVKFADITEKGDEVAKSVVEYLTERIEDIKNGNPPNVSKGEFSCTYFHYEDGQVHVKHVKRPVP